MHPATCLRMRAAPMMPRGSQLRRHFGLCLRFILVLQDKDIHRRNFSGASPLWDGPHHRISQKGATSCRFEPYKGSQSGIDCSSPLGRRREGKLDWERRAESSMETSTGIILAVRRVHDASFRSGRLCKCGEAYFTMPSMFLAPMPVLRLQSFTYFRGFRGR